MATGRVADLTMQELKTLIRQVLDEQISNRTPLRRQQSDRPVAEVLEEMRKNIWTPPPSAKSSLELLREDRDR